MVIVEKKLHQAFEENIGDMVVVKRGQRSEN
jgi:hypothetical protein